MTPLDALILYGLHVFYRADEFPIASKDALLLITLHLTVKWFTVWLLSYVLDKGRVLLHVLTRLELHLFQVLLCSLNNHLLNFRHIRFYFLTCTRLLKSIGPALCALSWFIWFQRNLRTDFCLCSWISKRLDPFTNEWAYKRRGRSLNGKIGPMLYQISCL